MSSRHPFGPVIAASSQEGMYHGRRALGRDPPARTKISRPGACRLGRRGIGAMASRRATCASGRALVLPSGVTPGDDPPVAAVVDQGHLVAVPPGGERLLCTAGPGD